MVTVIVRHKVESLARWKPVFDAAVEMRKEGGERRVRLFRDARDPNELTLLVEFGTMEEAETFMGSARLREEMAKSGVIGNPSVQYLSEMIFPRRTSAD